jgi:hypothetical protein
MNAQHVGLIVGIFTMAGCASTDVAQKDTLNERSDRIAHLDDRQPPNPNRPNDTRDLKAIPTVVQHDPALNKPAEPEENKGLTATPGADQLVRPQDPTVTDATPKNAGTPAQSQTATITNSDSELATRVKDALSKIQTSATRIDPLVASPETNGEAKAIQNIDITAKNGLVTISGSVSSDTERSAIEQAATRVPGVISVSNYLTVSKSEKQ